MFAWLGGLLHRPSPCHLNGALTKGANKMPKITKPNERWFPFPDDPLEGRVKIKHLSPGELAEISDESFKTRYNYKAGKGKKAEKGKATELDVSVKQNPVAYRELPIKKSIVDWENFFDEKDKKMECTPENIEKSIRQLDGFVNFIEECRKTLKKDIAKEKEGQAKNLKGSASKPAK